MARHLLHLDSSITNFRQRASEHLCAQKYYLISFMFSCQYRQIEYKQAFYCQESGQGCLEGAINGRN